jgi:hypothetical protein
MIDRAKIEAAIEALIGILDAIDGDADCECGDAAEDDDHSERDYRDMAGA